MLQDFGNIFKRRDDVPCQSQIEKQNESRMTRAWVLHSLKTLCMGVYLYCDTAYWEKEADSAFPYSGNEDLRKALGSLIIALLIASVSLDLVIW